MPTKENATLASHRRKVPALTIYVLSTNGGNEKSVGFLFSELPHRMYRIESTDFFTKEQGCYDTFGVDRAASLYSAYACDQHPALVMDGGTAWTYTGIDANGKIMGGGISPGLGARFRSLSDYCGKLPSIDFNVYDKVFKHVFEQKKPLPVFATETQTAMITSVFQEVTVQCRQLVCQFLKEIEQTPKQNGETAAATATDAPSADAMPTEPKKPTIFVTGGDSAFLLHALQSDTAIVPEVPGFTFPKDKFEVLPNKHLIHYGVGRLLKNKFGDMDPMDPENGLRFRLVGQRVAKEFLLPDTDGEFLYRGSIISVKPGKTLDDDIYLIRYDDGDQEHLELTEVHGKRMFHHHNHDACHSLFLHLHYYFDFVLHSDALKLYVEIGEKASADTVVWTEELRKEKKEESTKVMEDLKEQNEVVKAHAEKVEKAKAEAAAAAAAEAAKAPPPGETPDGVSPTREVKPKRVSSATRKVGRKPKRAKVSPEVEDRTKMYLKRRVAKNFPQENEQGELEDVLFFGTVMNISKSGYWHVVYDDDVSNKNGIFALHTTVHALYPCSDNPCFFSGRGRFR